jgi:hypothetical protein
MLERPIGESLVPNWKVEYKECFGSASWPGDASKNSRAQTEGKNAQDLCSTFDSEISPARIVMASVPTAIERDAQR